MRLGKPCSTFNSVTRRRSRNRLAGVSAKVWKLVEDHDKETYRVVYTLALSDAVYVLHAFQKKSRSGRATPQSDRDLVTARMKDAVEHHRELQKSGRAE